MNAWDASEPSRQPLAQSIAPSRWRPRLTHRLCVLVALGIALVVVLLIRFGFFANARLEADVKLLGRLYQAYEDHRGRPPSSVDDLESLVPASRRGLESNETRRAIERVKSGEFVLVWDAWLPDRTKYPGSGRGQVLGYEWQIAYDGGVALMVDGSARRMTANEFNRTKVATKIREKRGIPVDDL